MKIKTKKIYIYKCRFIITEDLDAVIGCFIAVIVQCQGIMLFHEEKKFRKMTCSQKTHKVVLSDTSNLKKLHREVQVC